MELQRQKSKTIHLALLSEQLDSELTEKILIGDKGAVRYRDAYYLKFDAAEAWIFSYGVLVCWNLTVDQRLQLINDLKPLLIKSCELDYSTGQNGYLVSEQYSYLVDETKTFRIQHDILLIDNHDLLCRLALSHAFAQSAKLQFFEETAQQLIQNNKAISKNLAATGQIPLSRKKLAKLRGLLFDTSSDITLNFNLLDTPEFFWDYPEVESYYLALAKYLDLKPRIDLLNYKLSTIHELLEMLASEQHHKHSAFLEWIIIILIAVDIVIYFLP